MEMQCDMNLSPVITCHQGEDAITREHVDNNAAVRKMLTERGIVPENRQRTERSAMLAQAMPR